VAGEEGFARAMSSPNIASSHSPCRSRIEQPFGIHFGYILFNTTQGDRYPAHLQERVGR
jgi:hypothetical protein